MRTVITHFYNEEYLLPFWIKHHREIFDYGILINYKSTDKSVDLIKKYAPSSWQIVDSENDTFDGNLCDLEVMRYEQKVKGWKIALNVTEFFICPNIDDIEKECSKNNFNGFKTQGIVVVDHQPDQEINLDIPIINQKCHGFLEQDYNYNIEKLDFYLSPQRGRIYHKKTTGIYYPGRHQSFLKKVPTLKGCAFTMWYGFSPWNRQFIKRKLQISKKISLEDIERGWGVQHFLDSEKLNNTRNIFLKQSYDLSELIKKGKEHRDFYFDDIDFIEK